jgi:hypothetical protein
LSEVLINTISATADSTGDTRVNFVGHGTDFNQEGAQSLADKVKILQQTYGNNNTNNTNIGRIALVMLVLGCLLNKALAALTAIGSLLL